jgi:GNAT superfamily N-acetyltransferase
VNRDSWRVAYRDILPATVIAGRTVEEWEPRWREFLAADETRQIWVAESGESVVGYASASLSRDPDASTQTGEVPSIYLAPSHYSTGVGRELFATAVDWLAERFDRATLLVLRDNARARRFYELAGWSFDGLEQSIDFGGFEAIEVRYAVQFETGPHKPR